MPQESIIFPLIALVALTFGIAIWFAIIRVRAVKNGDINPGYYQLNRGAKLPEYYAKVNNNYKNLLEIPILFYIISILIYVTNNTDLFYVICSWIFVLTRYIHSYIHTTYNNVRHRRIPFLVGVLILIIEWGRFCVQLL